MELTGYPSTSAMRSDKVVWIGLAFLLLSSRTAILLLGSTGELSGDGFGYFGTALHLAETGTLPPLGIQPHGYPVLISPIVAAANQHPVAAVQIFQVFLDLGLVAALNVIAWRALAPYSAVVAGLMLIAVSIQPFTATLTCALITESANMFLLAASLFMFATSFIQGTVPIAASVLLGLSATTRVELIPLAVALCGAYWLIIGRQKCLQPSRASWMSRRETSLVLMLIVTIMPLMGLIALQAASTGQVGVVRWEPWNPGYAAWMRTWFANEREYPRFHFDIGQPSWEGFRIEAYPKRAFANDEERAQISDLLKKWQADGYTPELDQAFATINRAKRDHAPATYYVILPLLRMAHFWINLDGAQSFLRVVHVKRPYSFGIVGLTIALRVFFIVFATIGATTVWRPTSASRLAILLSVLGRAASILIALRTVELGILGTIVWGGLMEIRYANIAFPAVILLAIAGVQRLTVRMYAAGVWRNKVTQ